MCVMLSLLLLLLVSTDTMAHPTLSTRTPEELRSGIAMAQMILAQQAQLFRELINATKESHSCCSAGKSGKKNTFSMQITNLLMQVTY